MQIIFPSLDNRDLVVYVKVKLLKCRTFEGSFKRSFEAVWSNRASKHLALTEMSEHERPFHLTHVNITKYTKLY